MASKSGSKKWILKYHSTLILKLRKSKIKNTKFKPELLVECQKFFTVLLLVEKSKFLQGEVLVQNFGPRSLKFLVEVLFWIPPQPEVTMRFFPQVQFEVDGPQWDGTSPTEVVHEVSSTNIEMQCSKTSRSSKSFPKKKSANKMKFANEGVRCFHPVKKWSWRPCKLPRKIGVRFEVPEPKSCSQIEVHGNMAVKWRKTKRSEGPNTLKWNTAVSVAKFLKFVPKVFQTNEVAKPQRNQTKRSVVSMAIYPKYFKRLRGVLWKIRAYIRKCVRMKCETMFYTRAVRS